ncbi:hypothetical protein D3C87_492930 [compost metagenome]
MEVIGDRVIVDFADRAFLCTDAAREITEMVDRQRNIRIGRLAQRLAVIPGFGPRDEIEIVLDTLGDPEQDVGAFRYAGLAPFVAGLVCCVERELDVRGIRAGNFADLVARDRRKIIHVAAGFRLHPFAADVIAIFQLEGRFARFLLNLNIHDFILPDENDPRRTAWEKGGPRWRCSVEGRRCSAAHIVSHLRQRRFDPA